MIGIYCDMKFLLSSNPTVPIAGGDSPWLQCSAMTSQIEGSNGWTIPVLCLHPQRQTINKQVMVPRDITYVTTLMRNQAESSESP